MLAAYFAIIFLVLLFAMNAALTYLYYLAVIDISAFSFLSTAAVSFAFSISTVIYLRAIDKSKKGVLERLGLGRSNLTVANLLIGIFLFLIMFLLEVMVGLIGSAIGVQINTNAQLLLAGAPAWFLVFASVLAPVNEEVLFRGLMVPRLGILLSAILFGMGHYTYMSTGFTPSPEVQGIAAVIAGIAIVFVMLRTRSWSWALTILIVAFLFITSNLGVEVIAAFVFGALAGYVFRRTGSLYPPIVAHVLVNTLTLVSTFSFLI